MGKAERRLHSDTELNSPMACVVNPSEHMMVLLGSQLTQRIRRSATTAGGPATVKLTPALADFFGDGGDYFVEVADDGPVGLGDHVGFGVGVDGQDVL